MSLELSPTELKRRLDLMLDEFEAWDNEEDPIDHIGYEEAYMSSLIGRTNDVILKIGGEGKDECLR